MLIVHLLNTMMNRGRYAIFVVVVDNIVWEHYDGLPTHQNVDLKLSVDGF